MNTRVVSRSVQALAAARLLRNHVRLIVAGLMFALIGVALYGPSRVESVAAPLVLDPPGLVVTAVSNTSISLSWNSVPNATEYQLERSESMSGPFTRRDATTSTSFVDSQVTAAKAFIYRVRAIRSSQTGFEVSLPSNLAFGTPFVFEFAQLQGKTISARHFDDLRTTVNAVRSLAALPEVPEQNLGGEPVRAADVLNLRLKLDEALNAMFISRVYTDPTLITGANGTLVKAVHVEELQTLSTRGFSNSSGPLYLNTSKAVGGEFSGITNLPIVPVHLSVLPDRRILFWGRDMLVNSSGAVKQRTASSDAYVWNMSGGMSYVPNFRTNLFCSGHSFLPNGDLFVTGGHRSAHFDGAGEDHTNIFDYDGNTWSAGPNMNKGRWYPYNVTISTGEPLIMGGSYWFNEDAMNIDPYNPEQFFDPKATPTPDIFDNLFSQIYTPAQGGGFRTVTYPPNARLSPYPYLHLLSNGFVFQAQSGFNGNSVDQVSRLLDPINREWPESPLLNDTQYPHANGSSVLLKDDVNGDTVMLIGGFNSSSTPTKLVETIRPLASTAWSTREPMKFARTYHTATLLPDGKVLVTGGVACGGRINIAIYDKGIPTCSDGAVLSPELWDPSSGKWTTMNKHSQVRAYHSVAALLPDGRVLVGGGGLPGAVGEIGSSGLLITNVDQTHARLFGHNNVEIFSPPYLFDANGNPASRPLITSTPPESVTYGQQFFLGTSGAGSQPKVSYVRLASVTHGNNQDQRVISVTPTLVAGGIQVPVPTSPAELPPGYYMVFVMNGSVPSVAAIIRVQNQSFFTNDTPQTTTAGPRELGLEFSSSVNGQITHVRFYKRVGESGTHTARIWDASGLLLTSVMFSNETSSGWQTAILQTPLSITAHAKYKVSYNIHNVGAKTNGVLGNPITNGPLVGWGSYTAVSGSVPTTFDGGNLFVDVIFK